MTEIKSFHRLYRDCPTDPDRILDYFNNYNGGIINQVQPQVDNEVTPLVTKIGQIIYHFLESKDKIKMWRVLDGSNLSNICLNFSKWSSAKQWHFRNVFIFVFFTIWSNWTWTFRIVWRRRSSIDTIFDPKCKWIYRRWIKITSRYTNRKIMKRIMSQI